MGLQSKLDDMRTQFEASAPPETLAIMHAATDNLQRSGIMEHVLKIGDQMPVFELPNQQGDLVSSQALLRKGPVVVSFYRGVW